MGCKSEVEKEKLLKFRQNVADILKPEHNDAYLQRWLRARDFDVTEAEKMIRAHMKWRAVVKADEILRNWTPPQILLTYYPGGLYGYDKEGRPIWIEPVGKTDVKGIMASAKKSDLMKYKIWHCELVQKTIYEQSMKLGKDVGFIIIFDMEDFSIKHLWKPAMDFYSEVLMMCEANYPEALDQTLIINAPSIFPIAYNLLKPFLNPATRKKIKLLGSNWKNDLLKLIDADQLPVHWGGTATDPDGDPFCRSKIPCGGKVDPKYYVAESSIDHQAFTEATVARRASLKLPFTISDAGSMLRWQFITEGYDIQLGITFKCDNDRATEKEIVVPFSRLNSHLVPEDGSIACEKPGIYTVTFDNSYSWTNKKKLLYQIDVLPPPESTEDLKLPDS